MRVAEIFEAAREQSEIKIDLQRWKKLVNMPTKHLEMFLGTQEGRDAGLSPKEAKKAGGIKTGRASARAILRMRAKPFTDWTTEDINWMYRQISFISRMSGVRGALYKTRKDGTKIPTRKLTSLWVWGHVPPGHSPTKYPFFKQA